MPRVDPGYLNALQGNQQNIRNICILAHVDHGKTTLSDSLVSSNGLISTRMAGKVRYLDSEEDEQKRGITMHASAISLEYTLETPQDKQEYLINLVDSPGHIDFSCDVSTATRLCDGALILVDVVEGVCTQTHAVMFKALKEGLHPILVLNKIDRLILELQLSPAEAFSHFRRVVENVNALASTLVQSLKDEHDAHTEMATFEDVWSFSPAKGNVIFSSAMDCWAFTVQKFATIWSKKLEINRQVLLRHFFDDFYFNPKTKKLMRCDPMITLGGGDGIKKPLFVSMILEPIWTLYETAVQNGEPEKAVKMASRALEVSVRPRDVSTRDPRMSLQAIFQQWLPLADTVLRAVTRQMPCPIAALAISRRVRSLLPKQVSRTAATPLEDTTMDDREALARVTQSITTCDCSKGAPVVIFVSKLITVRAHELAPRDQVRLREASAGGQGGGAALESSTGTCVAIARIFSGTLTSGCDLYVLPARHIPEMDVGPIGSILPSELVEKDVTLLHNASVYLCLGPSVCAIPGAAAGNIVGLWVPHMEDIILKTATLSNSLSSPSLQAMIFQAQPMVRVAVEPESHVHLIQLDKGLRRLHRFDAAVQISLHGNGQRTMTCLGELHLEQCIKLLRERFAQCEIHVSEPLVALRESLSINNVYPTPATMSSMATGATTATGMTATATATGVTATSGESDDSVRIQSLPPPWGDMVSDVGAVGGTVRVVSSNGAAAVTLEVHALPSAVTALLDSETHDHNDDTENNHHPPHHHCDDDDDDSRDDEMLDVDDRNEDDNPSSKRGSDAEQDMQALRSFLLHHRGGMGAAHLPAEEESARLRMEMRKLWKSLARGVWNGQRLVVAPLGTSKSADQPEKEAAWRDVGSRVAALSDTGGNLLMVSTNPECVVWPDNVPVEQSSDGGVSRAHPSTGASVCAGAAAQNDSVFAFGTAVDAQVQRVTSDSDVKHARFAVAWSSVAAAVTAAFDSACKNGPLMGEPLQGVLFVVTRVELCADEWRSVSNDLNVSGCKDGAVQGLKEKEKEKEKRVRLHSGQFISEVVAAFRGALLSAGMRVVEPIYACGLQCDVSRLGDLHSVLSRRRGTVVSEDIVEGTSLFLMESHLPILESFGFAQELLKKTSGSGTTPLLRFSHWNTVADDPFWQPTTDAERDEHGEVGAFNSHAKEASWSRSLIVRVRRRKGLHVEELVVASAEKQRTLKR